MEVACDVRPLGDVDLGVDDAVLTGQAAAHWHGLPAPAPSTVQVTVPRCRSPRRRPGVRVRRRDLLPVDISTVGGIRVAAPPLAALEAAVALPDGAVFLDRVLQRHVRFPALYRCFCRNMGRHGSPAAGHLVRAAADRADSAAERVLKRLLPRAGITGWQVGVPFGPYTIDLAFPEAKVAVEVDGWTVDHGGPGSVEGQAGRPAADLEGAVLGLEARRGDVERQRARAQRDPEQPEDLLLRRP